MTTAHTVQGNMLQIDMTSLMSEITALVSNHVQKSVLQFNRTNLQREIDDYIQKVHDLNKELTDIQHTLKDPKCTRSQQTSAQISVALLVQDIGDYEKKIADLTTEKESLLVAASSCVNNIMIDICDVPITPSVTTQDTSKKGKSKSSKKEKEHDSVVEVVTQANAVVSPVINIRDVPEPETEPTSVMEEEEEEEETDDGDGVFEIEIGGVNYYTTDDRNGTLYDIDEENGDPGEFVGYLRDGKVCRE